MESVLGARVAADQPLMEAGLDSLGALDLCNAVSVRFSIDLPATATFDYPTVQVTIPLLPALAPLLLL